MSGGEEATARTQNKEAIAEEYRNKNRMPGTKPIQDKTTACRPTTAAEEVEKEAEEAAKETAEREDYRNRPPDSIEQKLEEMKTQTGEEATRKTADNEVIQPDKPMPR